MMMRDYLPTLCSLPRPGTPEHDALHETTRKMTAMLQERECKFQISDALEAVKGAFARHGFKCSLHEQDTDTPGRPKDYFVLCAFAWMASTLRAFRGLIHQVVMVPPLLFVLERHTAEELDTIYRLGGDAAIDTLVRDGLHAYQARRNAP